MSSSSSSASYQPLARRYRPQRFDGERGLVGQPHVARTLSNAILNGTLANAYLLAGPRGTGKTTTARILAAALNCGARDGAEPCGQCPSCERILTGKESQDVVEIDAATNRSVDDARTLRQQAQYAPSTATATKVYILDEAHMLSREAWNALLKVLEEPPPRVIFVFCTTEPQKIEQTAEPVLSRCQRLDMRRITHADLVGHLRAVATREGIHADDDALTLIARRADGGMRDALSILDQLRAFQGSDAAITPETVRDAFGMQAEAVYLGVLDLLADTREARARAFKLVRHLDDQGADFVRFLEEFQDTLGAAALVQEGGIPEGWSAKGIAGLMKRAGRTAQAGQWVQTGTPRIPTADLVDLMALCQEEARIIRQAPRPSTVMLTLLQRMITQVGAALTPRPSDGAAPVGSASTAH